MRGERPVPRYSQLGKADDRASTSFAGLDGTYVVYDGFRDSDRMDPMLQTYDCIWKAMAQYKNSGWGRGADGNV